MYDGKTLDRPVVSQSLSNGFVCCSLVPTLRCWEKLLHGGVSSGVGRGAKAKGRSPSLGPAAPGAEDLSAREDSHEDLESEAWLCQGQWQGQTPLAFHFGGKVWAGGAQSVPQM